MLISAGQIPFDPEVQDSQGSPRGAFEPGSSAAPIPSIQNEESKFSPSIQSGVPPSSLVGESTVPNEYELLVDEAPRPSPTSTTSSSPLDAPLPATPPTVSSEQVVQVSQAPADAVRMARAAPRPVPVSGESRAAR